MPEAAIATPPAPPPSDSVRSTPNLNEAFAGFDALVAAPDPPVDDTKPPADDKPPVDQKPPVDTKPPTDQKPPVDTKPPGDAHAPTKFKSATLREELDRMRVEAADWRSKYEAHIKESATPKPDLEKEQLLKSRDEWNKSREQLETELKFANYERSPEYKTKYQEPFLKAYEQAGKTVCALSLKEPDKLDEFGALSEAGAVRKGTEADWESLMSITDEDTANKFITERFGHNAARVTLLRDKVLDLHGQMRSAIEDFQKHSGERETQMRENLAQQQKAVSEHWHKANAHALEKYPQYFAPDPADPKGNTLLEQGIRLTDLAFGVLDTSEFDKLPDNIRSKMVDGKLPQSEMILLHSAIRNRAAAYSRLVYKLTQAEAALKDRDEKLSGYEDSSPGRGQPRKGEQPSKKGPPGSMAEIDAAFDALAAQNG